jgi:hypothetical protein
MNKIKRKRLLKWNKSLFATKRLNKRLNPQENMINKLIKRRNTMVMKFTTKLNSNKMRLDSEAIVGIEATEEVASEITINKDLS